MKDRSKKCTRWVLLLGLLIFTGCSTKPLYDEGLILELYPTRFEDGLYIHAFFQFSPPQSTGWERVELQSPRRVMLQKRLNPGQTSRQKLKIPLKYSLIWQDSINPCSKK